MYIIFDKSNMGIGAMPDYLEFNDVKECNTIKNVAQKNGGLNITYIDQMKDL